MKSKLKFFSIILFLSALLAFIPSVSQAYDSDAEVPINYTIKINKIDSADNRNLKGAKFTLKDVNGNVVATQTTDEDGILSFGNIRTYGSGTDIYYIEEVKTPRGYVLDEKETIEVNVEKKVINVETGGYKLKITCQTLNYDTDITRYDFVPVSTVDQLKHIGSGAIYVFDGKPYRYTANTNYRLMNDIDLSKEQWEPIDTPISGIFDGNGYSIKNLTIASNDVISYKEVGLFKVFSGIVCNLNMENVNIYVPGYTETATSNTGKGGVGAFAGLMGSGTIKNCTVSGNISSNVDNVGGLVGHTAENVIIKIQDCTNYANITDFDNDSSNYTRYNVGGLIGCAMCSLSVNNCNNEGTFGGNSSNVGGLVGHVESQGYQEKAVKAGYAEDGNTITLVIGNSRSEGEYDLYLEDYDLRSLNILPGGVFTVYDSTLEPIEGFENITLEEGRLRIGTVNIKFEGKDTYFVKDVTPVEGYRKIAGYIKVVVTRYWDFEAERFRVTVDEKVISEDKIQEELGNNTDIDLDSISDTFAPEITFENVGWNTAKAIFVNCTNNAEINGYRDVGGLVGSAHKVKTTFENCTNNKAVSGNGYGKAAGIIAELYYWEDGIFCEITNCKNYGKISSDSSSCASAGGMVSQVISNIKVTNCTNEGEIYSTGPSGAGGILCDATGAIIIDKCNNRGKIETDYDGVNAEAGGIVAKNVTKSTYASPIGISSDSISRSQNTLTITNCENTGDVLSAAHMGGILGCTEAGKLTISNCKVYSKKTDEKLQIHDKYAADKGGIAGYVCVPVVKISDCTVEDVDLKRTRTVQGKEYGVTGGIMGNWCSFGNANCTLESIEIKDCNVNRCNITTKSQNTAGILGGALMNPATITIKGCKVDECNIHNQYGHSTYASVAGILAMTYSIDNISIEDCDVTNSTVTLFDKDHRMSGNCNVGGIAGVGCYPKSYTIKNCNVINTKLKNYTAFNSGCSTTGGIIAHIMASDGTLTIDGCSFVGEDKENKTEDDADIFTNGGDCGGIAGPIYKMTANISNTTVKDCYLLSNSVDSTSSMMSGMVTYVTKPITMNNCTVDNIKLHLDTQTSVGGTNITGFLGVASGAKAEFNNCDISNSTFISPGSYNSSANIAGIAGYTSEKITFNGCDVYNCSFNGTNVAELAPAAAQVTGILGCNSSSSLVEVNGCSVKKCEMTSKSTVAANSGNCTVSGMVGVAGKIKINGSSVENCSLKGSAMCTAGVVACVWDSAELYGVTVKDLDIYDRRVTIGGYSMSLRSIGGVIAYANKFTGTSISVSDVDIASQSLTIGGIVASTSNPIDLTESSVSDLTVTNIASEVICPTYGAIAGIAGQVCGGTISGCTVSNATLTGDFDTVAGLVGCMNGKATVSGCTVSGFTGKNKNVGSIMYETGHSGGLIGISTGATELAINSSKVNNSSITIGNADGGFNKSLGGLIGISGDVTLNGCEVNSVSLTNGSNGGIAGGLVGQVDKDVDGKYVDGKYVRTLTVNDSKVTGEITISSVNHAGGMVGCGKVIASNPTVTGITVKSLSDSACVGGIVGITELGSSIEGADISGITVTSKLHAGGMASVMFGTITGGTVDSVTITSNGAGEAGAVAGVLEGSLSGTTINNATISSASGDVGGAVGATRDSVSGVTVTNTTVSSPKVIGGVVGAGLAGFTTLSDLSVDDATADAIAADTTAVFKGKFIGVPSEEEENPDAGIETTSMDIDSIDEDTTEDTKTTTTKGASSNKTNDLSNSDSDEGDMSEDATVVDGNNPTTVEDGNTVDTDDQTGNDENTADGNIEKPVEDTTEDVSETEKNNTKDSTNSTETTGNDNDTNSDEIISNE